MPLAKSNALEAVKRDPALAEGHTSLGYVLMSYDWDLPAAAREFRRAIELNPGYATAHHWYGHYWLAAGSPDRALEEMRLARLSDPRYTVINTGLGWCLYHARRFDEAIEQYRATLSLDPNFQLAHCTLGMALARRQRYGEAFSEFQAALALDPGSVFAQAGMAATAAQAGNADHALNILERLESARRTRYVPAIYLASVYASLGNAARSLEWAQRAFDERSEYMIYLKTEPWLDAFRADPRFRELLQRVERGGAE
jgi:Tfp pilus assembly protein PilF